jgi:hypothetical protein
LAGIHYQETASTTSPYTSLNACQNTGTSTTTGSSVTVNTVGTRYIYACAYDAAGNYLTATGTYTITAVPTVTAVSPDNSLTGVVGQEITITGTDFTGATAVTVGGEACTPFTVANATTITCTLPLFDQNSAGVKSILVTTPGGTNTANTLFTVVASYVSVTTDGNVNISSGLSPTVDGVFVSASNTATVTTNNLTGYKLNISTNQPDSTHASDMAHQSIPGHYLPATANLCTWTGTTLTNTATALSNNTYGFTLSAANLSAQKLCKIPDSSAPLTVKTTAAADEVGDSTTIYFGAKVNTQQLAGQYKSTVVYTVVANP